MYFTSGTTGEPKMVAHDFTYPLGHIVTASFWHNLHRDSLHLTIADTGWGKAVWGHWLLLFRLQPVMFYKVWSEVYQSLQL